MDAADALTQMQTVWRRKRGGGRVELRDGALRNECGSLAGSHLNMIEAVRKTIAFAGVHWAEIVRMASSYPARAIGVSRLCGLLAPGRRADMVELNEDLTLRRTWIGGAPA